MKAQDTGFNFTLPNIRSIILGHEHNSTFKKNTFVEISIEILIDEFLSRVKLRKTYYSSKQRFA